MTPFLDSLIDNTGISDVFSIQLCGDKFEQQTDKDVELGGTIVSLIDLIILIYLLVAVMSFSSSEPTGFLFVTLLSKC